MSETANPDSTARALGVTLAVAFVCALLVSVVAVSLRPVQQANIKAERINQLVREALSGIEPALKTENLEAHVVELASGKFDDSIDPADFDANSTWPGSSGVPYMPRFTCCVRATARSIR
jgi:Na+-transporting NADH:ubiquinone oxidoreductase subunit C